METQFQYSNARTPTMETRSVTHYHLFVPPAQTNHDLTRICFQETPAHITEATCFPLFKCDLSASFRGKKLALSQSLRYTLICVLWHALENNWNLKRISMQMLTEKQQN